MHTQEQTDEMSAAEIINKLLQQIGQLHLQMAALQVQNERLQKKLSVTRKRG